MAEDYELGVWCVVEMMGHRVLYGRVTDVELFGVRMVQVEVPDVEAGMRDRRFLMPAALYCLSESDEETCRARANPPRVDPLELDSWEDNDDDDYDGAGF